MIRTPQLRQLPTANLSQPLPRVLRGLNAEGPAFKTSAALSHAFDQAAANPVVAREVPAVAEGSVTSVEKSILVTLPESEMEGDLGIR